MIALLLLASLPVAGSGESRAHLARVSLAGPLERVHLAVEPMGATVIEGPLRAGEQRSIEVPLPLWAPPGSVEPALEVVGGGRASFDGWVDPLGLEAERAWQAVPAGLRARAGAPDPQRAPARAPPLALLAALAGLVLVLSLCARPWRAALVGAVCASGAFAATWSSAPENARLRVLEGDASADLWLAVDAAAGELALPAEAPLRVSSRPARARLVWHVPLAGAWAWEDAAARPTWILTGEGVTLSAVTVFAGAPRLDPGQNEWGTFQETWVRDAGEPSWTRRGTWHWGGALGSGSPGSPPGWLAAGLPQGPRVLVGRLDPATFTGRPPRGTPQGVENPPVWVRLTGFP